MIAQFQNIGAFLLAKLGIAPQQISGSTPINGGSIHRQGYQSCVLAAKSGVSTGGGTQGHVAKLQDSADGSTGWADLSVGGAVQSVTLDGDSECKTLNVNLAGAKEYIRVVLTPTWTGGTAPTQQADVTVVLGGADTLPAA